MGGIMDHLQHLSTEMQRCCISCGRGIGKRSKRQPLFMETKTVPSTGLEQTPTKGQSPHNIAHFLNKDMNSIASVFGGNLKTKCIDNQDL